MELKDIMGKKIAILCDTKEKGEDCVRRMCEFHGKEFGRDEIVFFESKIHEDETRLCYELYPKGWNGRSRQVIEEHGWELIPYDEFFKTDKEAKWAKLVGEIHQPMTQRNVTENLIQSALACLRSGMNGRIENYNGTLTIEIEPRKDGE